LDPEGLWSWGGAFGGVLGGAAAGATTGAVTGGLGLPVIGSLGGAAIGGGLGMIGGFIGGGLYGENAIGGWKEKPETSGLISEEFVGGLSIGFTVGAIAGLIGPMAVAAWPAILPSAKNIPAPNTNAPAHAFHRLEPRSIQSQAKISSLANDMKANGWRGDPIAVFEHGGEKYILDGHHRVAAARLAGIDVPYLNIPEANLPSFGFRNLDAVLTAASEAFGR
jgi:hypothetical protein